ncbi:EbsA family protein [Agrilactobacillus yilanensis]|uniref:EbsA family protein n=1 Tax=Agrilactobacillus yilanensis TaxID=2485997 RepID=A0ABW4J9I3_9LACO|nr:EbsA family protein [Agrilactobacillus yilanensis]
MTGQFKIHIYLAQQNQIIYWCFTLIALFVGFILQLEALTFNIFAILCWLIAALLCLYAFFGQTLVVDTEKNELIFKRLLLKSKHIALDNIKEIRTYKYNVRIMIANPKYIRYDFLVFKKRRSILIDTFKKNHVKILTMENNFH